MTVWDTAVERLAWVLFDADHIPAECPFDLAMWAPRAKLLLRELSLVAVDPTMIERLRATRFLDDGAIVGTYQDGGVSTDYGDACAELADAVLSQLK